MQVELKGLLPNRYRDFHVDPIDEDNVAELTKSIEEDGFWGGVTCRRVNGGEYEIAAGHHRVQAAMRAGIGKADLFVGKFDDAQMIRVYARENATQRGNHAGAVAGSVVAAVRYIAEVLLSGDEKGLSQICDKPLAESQAIGNLTSDKGIGEPIITRFLNHGNDEKLIASSTVKQVLAQLKQSGDYNRIVQEVSGAVEADAQAVAEAQTSTKQQKEEAEKKAARAKKAKDTPKKDPTFDLAGVAKYLKNDNQLEVFRKSVMGVGITPYLKVDQQAGLAKALVARAKSGNREMSGAFIKEFIVNELLTVKREQRRLSDEEAKRLWRDNLSLKAKHYQHDFARHCKGMSSVGTKLAELQEDWPKDLPFPITGEFRTALKNVKIVIDKLIRRI
jgi:hypothetical protein